jgi:hypothetical protein
MADGQINLISLDAIAARLGSRWATRSELVYEFTERMLERNIGDTGFHLRVSETDYLVVLPSEGKFAAQARCVRYLREVLTYFLGEARLSDLTIREVIRIGANGLDAALIDTVGLKAAAEAEALHRDAGRPPDGTVDRWTPFVASNGRIVRVSCALEPVFGLKNYERIGNRIVRRVLNADTEAPLTAAELQDFSRGDLEKIDLATIARGMERLRIEAGDERQLSLIIPVSYITLSHGHGRASVAALFAEAKIFVRTGVICEVCDIESVPQPALLTATSLIKSHCMFVIGRLAAAPDRGLGNLRDAGLQAVSFEAPQALVGDAEFLGWAKAAIAAAKLIAKSALIYRLNSPRHAGLAALLGASHASLRPQASSAAKAVLL